MKAFTRLALLSAALAIASPAFAGGRAPVGEPVTTPFHAADGSIDSMQAVRDAIVAAGDRHGWIVQKEAPGKLTMHLVVRQKHFVTVDVDYTTTSSTITYVTSQNMDYKLKHGEPWIHSSYVRWVRLLSESIRLNTNKL